MFCPKCGTKGFSSTQQFCRECGAEMNPPAEHAEQATHDSTQGPHTWQWNQSFRRPPFQLTQITVKDNAMKTVLMIAGALVLLPVAFVLVIGAILATVFAGFALIGLAFKLLPILAICIVVYWIASNRRHPVGSRM